MARLRTPHPNTWWAGSEEWFSHGPFATREDAEQFVRTSQDDYDGLTHVGRADDGVGAAVPLDADELLERIAENADFLEEAEFECSTDAAKALEMLLDNWMSAFVTCDKFTVTQSYRVDLEPTP